jgi:Putative prokaryotic signal transducing protein
MVNPEQERQRLAEFYAQMSEGKLLKVGSAAASLTELALQVLRLEFDRRGMSTAILDAVITDVLEYRELTMIRRYRDLPEALIAKTSLESAGIECFLADENIVRIDWFWSNLLGGVKLHVKTEDVDAALEILDQPAPESFDTDGTEKYERPRCPECGSIDIHFEELNPVAIVSTYFGVPLPLHRKGWKCRSCRHQWHEDANA